MVEILSRWAECIKHNVFLQRRPEDCGSVTFCFLITEGAEAEECLKSALEKRPFFGIMVSSHILRLNKSFSVIDFYPSFHSSPTYNYPSVSKGGPCHSRLWQCSRRSDIMNGKSTNSKAQAGSLSNNYSRSNLVTYFPFDSSDYEIIFL